MGFIVTAIGVTGFALGVPAVGVGATSVAFIVAFVRAAFGICLNRKLFALIAHLRGKELAPAAKRSELPGTNSAPTRPAARKIFRRLLARSPPEGDGSDRRGDCRTNWRIGDGTGHRNRDDVNSSCSPC